MLFRSALYDKVKGQTMIVSATTLGGVMGSIVGGSVIDHYGIHEVLLLGVISATVGAVLVYTGLLKRNKRMLESEQV